MSRGMPSAAIGMQRYLSKFGRDGSAYEMNLPSCPEYFPVKKGGDDHFSRRTLRRNGDGVGSSWEH